MDEVIKDQRFAHITRDPRFRKMKREQRKVKIDSRFKGMFSDKKFKLKYTVDKRGRPINTSNTENLRKYYDVSSSDSDESQSEEDEDSDSESSGSYAETNITSEFEKKKQKEKSVTGADLSKEKHITEVNKKKKTKDKYSKATNAKESKNASELIHNEELDKRTRENTQSKSKTKESNQKLKKQKQDDTKVGYLETKKSKVKKDKECRSDEEIVKESEESESSEESDDSGSINAEKDEQEDNQEESSSSDNESDEADKLEDGLEVDYARGEVVMESSDDSSTDDSDSEEEEGESEVEHDWGEIDKDAGEAEEVTRRLALCNMDWDRLSAQDIMVLLHSFKPASGVITAVRIYPSEFGLRRMKEEELKGPIELADIKQNQKKETKKKHTEEEEEGSEYQREKLREYQLKRLKYYYAVVECDSPATANHIYSECDGLEYEASANKLDIRFIPNDMVFDQAAKSVCTAMPDTASYKPAAFINSALQQSTVECTWDEDDRRRMQVTRRKFTQDELDSMDLQAYLASDTDSDLEAYSGLQTAPDNIDSENKNDESGSDESEDGDESAIAKYRQMLVGGLKDEKKTKKKTGGDLEEEPDMEMEISWEPGIKESTEKLVTKKTDTEELTPWEKYLKKKKEKKKEKRKQKREEELKKREKVSGSESDEGSIDNLVNDDDIPSDVDLNDPFFKDILGDATEKKNKTKKKTKKEKGKKKTNNSKNEEDMQKEAALEMLMMEDEDGKQHFNLKNLTLPEKESKTKRKMRLKKEARQGKTAADTFKMDVDDNRFKAVFENPHYNIDPSAPEYKKTQNMDSLVTEKVKRSEKRRKQRTETGQGDSKKLKQEAAGVDLFKPKEQSIESLVKSVKSKTKVLEMKKKKR